MYANYVYFINTPTMFAYILLRNCINVYPLSVLCSFVSQSGLLKITSAFVTLTDKYLPS